MSLRGVSIKDKKIKTVYDWPKPQLVSDNLIFLRFSNFYQYTIQSFSQIVVLPTCILWTTRIVAANKSIFAKRINEADSGNVIEKHNSTKS